MIVVTRLNGPRFAVDPDLLQRVESTPDTILTLIDGTKYIVAESMTEIAEPWSSTAPAWSRPPCRWLIRPTSRPSNRSPP